GQAAGDRSSALAAGVDLGGGLLPVPLRGLHPREAGLRGQPPGVPGYQGPAAPPPELWIGGGALHQPPREPAPAVGREDEDVAHVGVRGAVGHAAREADLLAVFVDPETERALQAALHDLARNAGRPVGLSQEAVDDVDVEERRVVADEEVAALLVHGRRTSNRRAVDVNGFTTAAPAMSRRTRATDTPTAPRARWRAPAALPARSRAAGRRGWRGGRPSTRRG